MRIAIIGYGSIGVRHAANLRALGETDLRVYDADPAVQDRLCEGGVSAYATLSDLWLTKPDVAIIATPPQHHVAQAFEAIKSGVKGLFIEKPLATSMDGVYSLADFAAAHGVITMVACQWRWRPGVADLLAQPGTLYVEADVPIPPERRTKLRWDIDWHFVDLALWGGRADYKITSTYDAPYLVAMQRGGMCLAWNGDYDASGDYVAEMLHFLRCIRDRTATGNDVRQAARVLKILLEERQA